MDAAAMTFRGRRSLSSIGVLALGVILALLGGGSAQAAARGDLLPGVKLFRTPDHKIQCVIDTKDNFARCIYMPHDAPMGYVDSGGRLTLCNRPTHCGFDSGDRGRVLQAGDQISGGGTTCTSKIHAMVCKSNRNGKGFRIDADKVKRVG